MNKHVYLAWQDQSNREWHVIGQLLRTDAGYEFRYTQGVQNVSTFSALSNMPDHHKVYSSSELFSLFKNRLMPKSRPDYSAYMSWMAIEHEGVLVDDLDALAISGGERETDFFRIIPTPEKNAKGDYAFKFFANGLSHMHDHVKERIKDLEKESPLYLAHDFQNKRDPLALFLRTDDPPCLIGYIPAYFTKVIHKIKNEKESKSDAICVKVVQVNEDAPIQMRLLCELSAPFLNKPWEEYEDEFRLIQ
jgi:hypothetical protein